MNALLVFLGCGLGGVLRYGMSLLVVFPYATLLVNISGSFVMGVLSERIVTQPWRAFLLIGILGGYTTFSSFSMETLTLFERGDVRGALINIGASVILCLIACWLGVVGSRVFR
jgi:Integral membrane protein possibly involved in chromosome condensation